MLCKLTLLVVYRKLCGKDGARVAARPSCACERKQDAGAGRVIRPSHPTFHSHCDPLRARYQTSLYLQLRLTELSEIR
jgi:hypothetical protein